MLKGVYEGLRGPGPEVFRKPELYGSPSPVDACLLLVPDQEQRGDEGDVDHDGDAVFGAAGEMPIAKPRFQEAEEDLNVPPGAVHASSVNVYGPAMPPSPAGRLVKSVMGFQTLLRASKRRP